MAGPCHCDEPDRRNDPLRSMPGRQLLQCVASDEEVELGSGVPPVQFLQRVHRVTWRGQFALDLVDSKGGLVCDGESQHRHALLERRYRIVCLERMMGAGNKPDLIENGLLAALLGKDRWP
jgi:hypothetical protein